MSTETQRRFVLAAVVIVLLPTLLVAGWLGWVWVHRSRPSVRVRSTVLPQSHMQSILHSQSPDHTVIVPFHIQDRGIFLKVRIGKKVVNAQLDTGSSANLWPADMRLGPIQERKTNGFGDVGGKSIQADFSTFKDMMIGDLELKNVPSYALNYAKILESHGPRQRRILILGDGAFAGCVLTIDYAKRELILHPAGDPPPKTAKCYHCFWTNIDSRTGAGNPTVLGSFEKRKASIALDTGWNNGTVGLSSSMYHQTLPKLLHDKAMTKTEIYQGIFGRSSDTLIPNCHFRVFDTPGTATADVVSSLPKNEDMVLGLGDLSAYRVTIDYPGSRVWLEQKHQPSPTQ